MGATTHSIDVSAPLTVVYNQWTQFEEFPRFMEGVIEIRQRTPKTLLWKVNIGGKEKQWEAEIVEQIPETRIVWESIDGTQNRGVISFESLDLEGTRITLTMEYEPEGILEMAGDALGIPSNQVEGDLKRFRDFIEKKATETGSWRGPVAGPASELSPHSAPIPGSRPGVKAGSQFYRDEGVLAPSHEQIAKRAYELYLARGQAEGYDREDWLKAEKQLSEDS
jgi:hypothetical protein